MARRDYTAQEAAAAIPCDVRTIQRHCAAGRIRGAYKDGPKLWRIPAAGLRAFERSLQPDPDPEPAADPALAEIDRATKAVVHLERRLGRGMVTLPPDQLRELRAQLDRLARLSTTTADLLGGKLGAPATAADDDEDQDDELDELFEAIDGAAALPYVTDKGRAPHGRPDQKQNELELICRSEPHVARFRGYAQRTREKSTSSVEQVEMSEDLLERYRMAMDDGLADRLADLKGWTAKTLLDLEIGIDPKAGRVVLPVRDGTGKLVGFCRYQPNKARRGRLPKMLAEGPRELFPAPERFDTPTVWVVEGEPDAVSMWSIDQPAVGIPGVGKWRDEWAERFKGFERVRILMDCDEQGRKKAEALQLTLAAVTDVHVVDLDPSRSDGYDVGDLILARGKDAAVELARLATSPASTVQQIDKRRDERDRYAGPRPFSKVRTALESMGCSPKRGADDQTLNAKCPVHDDRAPSLSVSEGDDGRVLVHCHAGCDPQDVVRAMGLEMKDLFAA